VAVSITIVVLATLIVVGVIFMMRGGGALWADMEKVEDNMNYSSKLLVAAGSGDELWTHRGEPLEPWL
jgi:hypothetical protein